MTFYEVVNYDRSGSGFSFDFKGYDFGSTNGGDLRMPIPGSGVEYALIYYVDPGPGVWSVPPDFYVLGISSVPYVQSAKGKALGLAGVDVKIAGSRAIGQIPVTATEAMPLLLDVNYPNGGKIWLVSAQYLAAKDACAWTTMTGWGAEILFETSLITYGFEPEQLVAE